MKTAKARIDAALEPLFTRQTNFLYKHRDAIAMFAAASSTASDGNLDLATPRDRNGTHF